MKSKGRGKIRRKRGVEGKVGNREEGRMEGKGKEERREEVGRKAGVITERKATI